MIIKTRLSTEMSAASSFLWQELQTFCIICIMGIIEDTGESTW